MFGLDFHYLLAFIIIFIIDGSDYINLTVAFVTFREMLRKLHQSCIFFINVEESELIPPRQSLHPTFHHLLLNPP